MDDTIARKINDAKSILLVVPTDIDFATIYATVSFSQTIKGKDVTVMNDAVTTNKLLIYKLKNFRFNALHTKATRSFTLVIDKHTNKIKQSFVDETEDKISLSIETEDNTFNPSSLVEVKRSKIDQDLILIFLKNHEQVNFTPNKYKNALAQIPQEKISYIICDEPGSAYTFWADTLFKYTAPTNFDEYSLTLLLASLIIECDLFASKMKASTFDLIEKLVAQGANYNDAFNVASNLLNYAEASYHVKEMANVKNMGNGIYYSHVDDLENYYTIRPPYMPEIARFADSKLSFVIITKKKYHHVFIVNNKERFDLSSMRKDYNGIGDDTYFYFKSKLPITDLEQDIIRKMIAITTGTSPVSQISGSEDMDRAENEKRFTQGLVVGEDNPLSPATTTIQPVLNNNELVPNTTALPQSNVNITIAEEA